MLRRHEIGLISGLVEGTLDDESEARALIERSREAREEFEAQRLSYEALHRVDPVSMSDHERAKLRRQVWTELRRDPSPSRRATPWIYRLAPFAAALILVVGVLGVLNRGFQGADETADTLADTAAGLLGATTEQAGTDVLEAAGDDAAPAAEGDGGADLPEQQEFSQPMPAADFFSTVTNLVRSSGFDTSQRLLRDFAGETGFQDVTGCLETAGLSGYGLVGQVTNTETAGDATTATEYLVAIPAGIEIGPDTEVVFVSLADCEVAHVED